MAQPLNPELYKLEGDCLDFYRKATGIEDEQQLKDHIITVQRKAYAVSRY